MATGALPGQILITGGRVYDPGTGKSRRIDVAVKNGRLVEPEALS